MRARFLLNPDRNIVLLNMDIEIAMAMAMQMQMANRRTGDALFKNPYNCHADNSVGCTSSGRGVIPHRR
ncbi:hypothetical protein [Undibacterium sp. SXout20W]|uniref:hypothetical protein n=1 Tax=Undibacterium sp. SXout20W TaxID=3413051 RepID=UPI003BF51765